MKATRKPSTTKGKSVNKTQISATLQDSSETAFAEPPRSAIHAADPHKKINYFNLKISSRLAPASNSAKISMHQRHYSVSQAKAKPMEGTNPAAAYARTFHESQL